MPAQPRLFYGVQRVGETAKGKLPLESVIKLLNPVADQSGECVKRHGFFFVILIVSQSGASH